MSEHQITGIEIHPATVTEAAEALTSGQVRAYFLLTEETIQNQQGGESVVVLTNSSFTPDELARARAIDNKYDRTALAYGAITKCSELRT